MTEPSKRVVFTMGGKGGVGKTGVVVALAEWFHANEIPVTLLDLDTENKARGSLKHFFDGTVTKVDVHTPAGLEAMGFLALLTRHVPKDIADERERFQESLELHRQFSDEVQQKMLGLVRELEVRISDLPKGIKAGLDPQQIAKILGESLRQHFLQSGISDTAKALQSTSAAMTGAQKELSAALHNLSDSHGGVVAKVERANNRLEYSVESRAKIIDALLHEWKSDLLRIWIPLVAGVAMLVGLFGGIEIQGCRDSGSAVAAKPMQTAVPYIPNPKPRANNALAANLKPRHESREKAKSNARHGQ